MVADDELMEFDSDRHEDPARELQLDDSYEDWYRNIGYWVLQKKRMTQVPKESVYDAAGDLDTGQDQD